MISTDGKFKTTVFVYSDKFTWSKKLGAYMMHFSETGVSNPTFIHFRSKQYLHTAIVKNVSTLTQIGHEFKTYL